MTVTSGGVSSGESTCLTVGFVWMRSIRLSFSSLFSFARPALGTTTRLPAIPRRTPRRETVCCFTMSVPQSDDEAVRSSRNYRSRGRGPAEFTLRRASAWVALAMAPSELSSVTHYVVANSNELSSARATSSAFPVEQHREHFLEILPFSDARHDVPVTRVRTHRWRRARWCHRRPTRRCRRDRFRR